MLRMEGKVLMKAGCDRASLSRHTFWCPHSPTGPRLSGRYKLFIFIAAALEQLSRILGTKEPAEERRRRSADHISVSVIALHEGATGPDFRCLKQKSSVCLHN